jgi:hypothetical protein
MSAQGKADMTRFCSRAPEFVAKGVLRRKPHQVAQGFNAKLDKPGSVRAQLYLHETMFARLREMAIAEGLSMGSFLREMITEALIAKDGSDEALTEAQRRYDIAPPGRRSQRYIELKQANQRALEAAR